MAAFFMKWQGRAGQGRAGQGRAGPVAMCKGRDRAGPVAMCKGRMNQSLCPGTTDLYDAAASHIHTHLNRALKTRCCCVLPAMETVLEEPDGKQGPGHKRVFLFTHF